MMRFRTEYVAPQSGLAPIGHDDRIVTVGSCFADEIGVRLAGAAWGVTVNPFGTLFNPASIAAAITDCVAGRRYGIDDVMATREGNAFVTFDRHSRFKADSAQALVDMLNRAGDEAYTALESTDILMLTLGSARCFVNKDNGRVVANCHRYPADRFDVVDLTVEQVVDMLNGAIVGVRAINPRVRVIVTVSPVRHISYGLAADSLSKATLVVAAHRLDNCEYFPAYEILVDDLRDYRFYGRDMVHPTDVAADYVMDCFANCYFSDTLRGQLDGWRRIMASIERGDTDRGRLIERIMALKPSEPTLRRFIEMIDRR